VQWGPRLGRELTLAWQIAEKDSGFFAIIAEWSRAEAWAPPNDNNTPLYSRGSAELGQRGAAGDPWAGRA
jgi:hypothetical protein